MEKPRIIFFDIDGTLIDMQKKQVTPNTLAALQRLQENGIKLCIATGRAPMIVPLGQFPGVEFDALLTFNGSYCYDANGTIYANAISNRDVHTIIRNATALGRPLCLATSSRLACNGADQDLVDYFAIAKEPVVIAPDFDAVAEGEVFQLMVGGRENEYARLMQDVQGAKIAAWWDRALDIIPADGGKGKGIRKVLEYYGLTPADAMAFGDGNNDIEMFGAVGRGVAMGNGSAELKAVAADVCGDVAEDGIYHYCLQHGLI